MSRLDRAIAALNECADALDDLPHFRRMSMLGGPIVVAQQLRNEAAHLEQVRAAILEIEAS